MKKNSINLNTIPLEIIIVNYNSTDCLIKCISSICSSGCGLESNIIIFDNNSKDNPAKLKLLFPKITLIRNNTNVGFSKAVNLSFKKSKLPFVMLLNPDTIVHDGLFNSTLKFMSQHLDVGVVGPAIYDFDGSLQGSARKFPSFLTSIFGRKSPITKIFPNNQITKREFACFNSNGLDHMEVDWVSGACMLIRREAFIKVGGFDENFFLYWEDTDFCRRIKDSGWKTAYFTKSKLTHIVGKSSDTKPMRSIIHFHQSCFKLFKKHAIMPSKLLMPLVFFGLTLRCFFVIGLNVITRKINARLLAQTEGKKENF